MTSLKALCYKKTLKGLFYFFLLTLAACGGEDDNVPKDNRVSVLPKLSEVKAEIAGLSPRVPEPTLNLDWTQSGGLSFRDLGNLAGPDALNLVWRLDIGETYDGTVETVAEPVISAGRVFILNAEGTVVAADTRDGERLWETPLLPEDDDEINPRGGGLAAQDGYVFAVTGFGGIYALDAQTGALKWSLNARVPFGAPPTLADGKLYVIDRDNRLQVIEAMTGKALWDYRALPDPAARERVAAASVITNVVISPFTSGELLAINATTRRPAWGHNITGTGLYDGFSKLNALSAHPVISGRRVFATSSAGITVAIDGATGKILWEREIAGAFTPLSAGSAIYLLDEAARLIALDKQTGQIYWVTELGAYADEEDKEDPIYRQGPVMVNGKLFLTASDGKASFINPENGEIIKKFEAPPSSVAPVVAGKALYILARDGRLYAYR